jgi:hypothetical protein
MKAIFLILILVPFLANSQSNKKISKVDSTEYYQKELRKLWHQNSDSLIKSEKYLSLRSNLVKAIQKRNDYTGLVLFADVAHSDYRTFNSTLSQNGFSELNPTAIRLGLGISHKRGNAMYDMYFGTLGFGNKSTKNNEKITTSFSNLLEIDFGIDILNVERICFYPYGGLSLRFSELKYHRSGQANSNYTFLSNMRTDENTVKLESVRLGYQYGIGFDYAVAYNRERTFKTIFFIKGGVNKPFKIDSYKSKGIDDFKPEIKQGDWLISVGIKFGNKR